MSVTGRPAVEIPRGSIPPSRPLPAGACDCHIHICDGHGRFPRLRETGYAPPHAPYAAHRAMLDATGIERSVGVQLMAYADDNGALVDGLGQAGGAMRGIAELAPGASIGEMERLHAAGVRGLRFFFGPPRPVPGNQPVGVGMADLARMAPAMRELGWIAEVAASCTQIAEHGAALETLGVPVLLEHMAGTTGAQGADHPAFREIVARLSSGVFWVKLTLCRMSTRAPGYDDLRPVHDALVEAAPGRMVWGSDWPHGAMWDDAPDVGALLDLFDGWIGHDDALRHTILCDNPERLFGFGDREKI